MTSTVSVSRLSSLLTVLLEKRGDLMIGLIAGTSEGREILSLLNKYTDDILVSTATEYGGELLKKYKFKLLNTKPLDKEEMIGIFKENHVNVVIDSSHPYAIEVSRNLIEVCKFLNIEYVRYERPSIANKFKGESFVIEVDDYEELNEKLKYLEGNILNTTGSRSLDKILKLKNRIIHRVLPSVKVMEECFDKGIKVEDLIAIKGPISYELNCSFIKEYNAKAILLKDSGIQGGTEEKIRAAIDMGIYAIVIGKKSLDYEKVFCTEREVVDFLLLTKFI